MKDPANHHLPLHVGGRGPGEEKWEYLDPDGTVRGVFPSEAMLNWNQSGYFHDDLPVRLSCSKENGFDAFPGTFTTLGGLPPSHTEQTKHPWMPLPIDSLMLECSQDKPQLPEQEDHEL